MLFFHLAEPQLLNQPSTQQQRQIQQTFIVLFCYQWTNSRGIFEKCWCFPFSVTISEVSWVIISPPLFFLMCCFLQTACWAKIWTRRPRFFCHKHQKQWFIPSFSILPFCLSAAVLTVVSLCWRGDQFLQPCVSPGGLAWPALSHDHIGWGWGLCAALYPLSSARSRFLSKACPWLADTEGRRALHYTSKYAALYSQMLKVTF